MRFRSSTAAQQALAADLAVSDPSYLICQGFIAEVSNGTFAPQLRLMDSMFPEETVKRKAELEERKRAKFRP